MVSATQIIKRNSKRQTFKQKVIGFTSFEKMQNHLQEQKLNTKDVSTGYSKAYKHFYERNITPKELKKFSGYMTTNYEPKK